MRILQPLTIPPGFDKRSTELHAEGRWIDGDKVHSVGGVIETFHGWEKYLDSETFLGVCRKLIAWRSLSDVKNVGIGTDRRLYALFSNALNNITPIRTSGTLGTNPFDTTNGSATVVVTHTSHGLEEGTFATFGGASAVGGITIDGEYEVTAVPDSDTYEIVHSSAATSTATGGGASVTYSYEINPGLTNTIDAFGYGVGPYGAGTYGTPRGASSVLLRARTWSIDNAGEDLICTPRDGNIYLYDYSAAGRAAILSNAPTANVSSFVAAEGHVVAVGAGDDRMAVAWSDIDDNNLWAAAADNQAGSFNLIGGSELINGAKLRAGYNLIWSDTTAFRMLYLGNDPWYSFRAEGSGGGLMGPNAFAEIDGIAYWMGPQNFYMYDGFVREILNQDDIRHFVFQRANEGVDRKQRDKVYAIPSINYREVMWLYQSYDAGEGGEIDRYVLYNLDEDVWYTGTLTFTAGHPAQLLEFPIAAGADGYVYSTDTGEDADGVAMRKFIRLAPLDLGDGKQRYVIHGFVPDFAEQVGDIELVFFTREQPQATEYESQAYSLATTTDIQDEVREAGRQAGFKLTSESLGGHFRIGRNKLLIEPDGDRMG